MADQSSSLNSFLASSPEYRSAWQKLQQGVVSGTRDSQDAAREAFGYTVRQLIKTRVDNPNDYVVNPANGVAFFQPDHSLRNTGLIFGGVLLAGAVGAYASAAGAPASAASSSVGGVGAFSATGAPLVTSGAVGAGIGETAVGYGLRYGLPVAGNLVNGYLQARAAGQASDAQQRYLEEALAYEKEKDAYDRKTAEEARLLEQQRYGDREGRLAPYRATGQSSNAQMASLLGLPTPPNGGIPAPRPFTPTTPLPYAPASSPPASSPPASSAAPASTGPLVTVRAPTGATRQVPEDQVAYWQSRGATVVEGASA